MTRQIPDEIVLSGRTFPLDSPPNLPIEHPDLDTRLQFDPFRSSSDCWRGYVATWEIRHRHLYLVGLRGGCHMLVDHPVSADWFSGILLVGDGPRRTEHPSFIALNYDREYRIMVDKGRITEVWQCDETGRTLLSPEMYP
jgi:hypothetical protein